MSEDEENFFCWGFYRIEPTLKNRPRLKYNIKIGLKKCENLKGSGASYYRIGTTGRLSSKW